MTRSSPAAYKVLIAVSSDKTGKSYKPGATITGADFPAAVIKNWLNSDPPVLAIKDGD